MRKLKIFIENRSNIKNYTSIFEDLVMFLLSRKVITSKKLYSLKKRSTCFLEPNILTNVFGLKHESK